MLTNRSVFFPIVLVILFVLINITSGQSLSGNWKLVSATYNNQALSNLSGSISVTNQLGYSAVFSDGTNRGDVTASLVQGAASLTSNLNGSLLALNGFSMQYTVSGGKSVLAWSASMSCSRTAFNQYGGTAILYGTNSYSLTNNLLTITSPGGATVLKYSFVPVAKTAKISLNRGWNLVSWNVDTANDSTAALLKKISSNVLVVLSYEEGGLTYDPKLAHLSSLSSMDHLHGYWIKMSSADTLSVNGFPVDYSTSTIPCEAGWNLISYLPTQADSLSHGFSSVFGNLVVCLGYNGSGQTFVPQLPSFNTLKVLAPFRGYWLKLNQESKLLYPQPLSGVSPSWQITTSLSKANDKGSDNIAGFINPANEWINLYGENVIFQNQPLPVGTIVQAKDQDGNTCGYCTVQKAGTFGFMPVYRDDPDTETDEGARPGESINLYFGEQKVQIQVKWTEMGDNIDIGAKLTAVSRTNNSQPGEITLAQNYPNPFNPQTTISYHLQTDLRVTLKIYNTLGQELVTLVDQVMQAGDHHVVWDGCDQNGVAAVGGLYLYTLQAGTFLETKRMLLLH